MAEERVQRRLAGILAADVVGYSRLMGEDEAGTRARFNSHLRDLIEPCIGGRRGRIVKTTGDGLLVEFASVVDAVQCAVEIQQGMDERNRRAPAENRISFRIGVNLGDVIVEGNDIHGDGVNVAARLEQMAEPGCICVSEDTYRQVRDRLEITWKDLGPRRLKNIATPVRIYSTGEPARSGVEKFRALFRRHTKRRTVAATIGGALLAALVAGGALWPKPVHWVEQGLGLFRSAPASSGIPVIAVLPFTEQSEQKQQRYLADGFTDELISTLGRFNSLRVISRNAVLPYKDRSVDFSDVRSTLGATYLVEGTVRRSDRSVRIVVRLADVKTATVRWTDRYDGEVGNLFEFQDAIARQIAGTVAASIAQIEGRQRLARQKPSNDAHDLVLQARAIGFGAERSDNQRFRALVNRAIELQPTYAAAHALLAEAVYSRVVLGWTEFADQELTRAEVSARRAIELAPDEPDGYRALGRILVVRGEYDQAEAALREAVRMNPSDASALAVWGSTQGFAGNLELAVEALEKGLKYDPTLEPNYVFDLAVIYYLARRHRDALRTAEFGIARYPAFPMFNLAAAIAATQLDQPALAKRYVADMRRRIPFFNVEAFGSRFVDSSHRAYLQAGLSAAGL